ncbi:AMIN-like domain-containing (lipo)protein [Kribbella sp. CA-253562]|uniref:AMIN-like domain-containing (lipo)protein n=1 Tax=Kribbella sp. CA-253562 TaxID=3239942 RepID=UPI003D8F1622
MPEATKTLRPATVENIRTGRHACFDRLVVDLAGPATAYQVRYVPVVEHEGSGAPVPARGGAKLRIDVEAPAYDDAGRPTYPLKNRNEVSDVRGFDTFRQVAWGGSFEGRTTLALGVRARLPFQTRLLAGPGTTHRLVVDVAHHW